MMDARERRATLWLALWFLVLLFFEMPGSWLIEPDESRYAEVPREMLASGDFITPRLDGTHFFDKPPLLYWANAASERALGITPFAARLPTRLAAGGTALLLLLALGDAIVVGWGAWAALLYLSAPLSFGLGRFNILDGLLTFTIALALLALRRALAEMRAGKSAALTLAGFGAAVGAAMLAKGLVAIVIAGLVLLEWAVISGRWRDVWRTIISPAPITFLITAVPYFVLVERASPGFNWFFFIHEHFLRYATHESHRDEPLLFFVPVFLLGFLPWTSLIVGARWSRARRALGSLRAWLRDAAREHPDETFFWLWLLTVLVFFSLSEAKLVSYILPGFPAAAALGALWIVRARGNATRALATHAGLITLVAVGGIIAGIVTGQVSQRHLWPPALLGIATLAGGAWIALGIARSAGGDAARVRAAWRAAALGWSGFYLALIIAMPSVADELSAHRVAVAAAHSGADAIVVYRTFPFNVPLEARRLVNVVERKSELDSDEQHPTNIFWTPAELAERWKNSRLAVVVQPRDTAGLAALVGTPLHVRAGDRKRVVVTNF